MSAGLAASTPTPGSTAPDVSLTAPAIDAWAQAAVGARRETTTTLAFTTPRMSSPRVCGVPRRVRVWYSETAFAIRMTITVLAAASAGTESLGATPGGFVESLTGPPNWLATSAAYYTGKIG